MLHSPAQVSRVPTSFIYGEVIGHYKGAPIYSQLTDNFGVVREFSGLITSSTQAKPGCIQAKPGLVYDVVSQT